MEKLTLKKLRQEEIKYIKSSLKKYLHDTNSKIKVNIKVINDSYSKECYAINVVDTKYNPVKHIYNFRVCENEVEGYQHCKVWRCDNFIEVVEITRFDIDLIKQVNYIFNEGVQPKYE